MTSRLMPGEQPMCSAGCAGCLGAVHAAVADQNDGVARDAAQDPDAERRGLLLKSFPLLPGAAQAPPFCS
jgi:hypothetical protein